MGNFLKSKLVTKLSPASPMEFNGLVSAPHTAGLEAEVAFSALEVKIDTAGGSIPEASVFVEFGLIPLYVREGRGQENPSSRAFFLGPGAPEGDEADHE